MKLRLIHMSDWHGQQTDVPWADAYFVTGDMLDNYPKYDYHYCALHNIPWIEPHREIHRQAQDVRRIKFRRYLGNPEAPVYIVRGNHDFVHLSRCFDGGPVFEFDHPGQVFDLCGLRVGGFRGVSYINGNWSDEFSDAELKEKVDKLPMEIDILLTHAPPRGIMDKVGSYGRGPRVGIWALSSYLNKQTHDQYPLKLHCFGHIHEQFGTLKLGTDKNPLLFSNAATGYTILDWDDGAVTVVDTVSNACNK